MLFYAALFCNPSLCESTTGLLPSQLKEIHDGMADDGLLDFISPAKLKSGKTMARGALSGEDALAAFWVKMRLDLPFPVMGPMCGLSAEAMHRFFDLVLAAIETHFQANKFIDYLRGQKEIWEQVPEELKKTIPKYRFAVDATEIKINKPIAEDEARMSYSP